MHACSSDAPEGCHCLRETYGIQATSSASEPAATAQGSAFESAFSESSSSTPGSPSAAAAAAAAAASSSGPNPSGRVPGGPGSLPILERSWLARFAFGSLFKRFGRVCLAAFFIVFRPVLFIVLRAVVRSKAFWVKGLKSAYADPSRLSEQTTYYYRLPALVRGWESGIVRFLQARLMSDEDVSAGVSAVDGDSVPGGSRSQREGAAVVGSYGVNFYTAEGVTTELETRQPGLLLDFERAVKETGVPVLIVRPLLLPPCTMNRPALKSVAAHVIPYLSCGAAYRGHLCTPQRPRAGGVCCLDHALWRNCQCQPSAMP